MIEVKGKIRKWGNSYGIIIPIKAVEELGVKEGEQLTAMIHSEKANVLRETFGKLKMKSDTDKMMREIDKELDIEF